MWEGAPDSEMISPSTRDTSTVGVEEVVAWGASALSVKAGTGSGNDVEGSSGSSSTPLTHCTLKDIMRTRRSLIEDHITWLNNGVSLKVKHTTRSAMRSIAQQDAIRRATLKLIKIAIFQDKALASKRHKMRDRRLLTKIKLKGGQMQNQALKDSIWDVASSADSVGPKAPRSPMLIEHHPSHLN
jgi:hypothetical protein